MPLASVKAVAFAASLALVASLGWMTPTANAAEADYPNRRITLVIPFTPGGNADLYGRTLANALGDVLGQPITVENRPGAGGIIAAKSVAKAPADGYTIFQSPSSLLVLIPIVEPSDFDAFTDMILVSRLFHQPYYLMVPKNSEVKSLKDIVAKAKAAPNQLKYGSIGINTSHHISGSMLSDLAGIRLVHVPYKGASDILPDLIAGRIDFTFGLESSVKAAPDQTRILCILAPEPSRTLPQIPSCSDAVPGLNFAGGMGLQLAKGTPPEIVKKIDAAVGKVMANPAFAEEILPFGSTPAEYLSTDAWQKDLANERVLFNSLAERTGLKRKP